MLIEEKKSNIIESILFIRNFELLFCGENVFLPSSSIKKLVQFSGFYNLSEERPTTVATLRWFCNWRKKKKSESD